jgi:hypothetical protein
LLSPVFTYGTSTNIPGDPCTLELGAGWRITTKTERTNVDAGGNRTNRNGPWDSALKMHAAWLPVDMNDECTLYPCLAGWQVSPAMKGN